VGKAGLVWAVTAALKPKESGGGAPDGDLGNVDEDKRRQRLQHRFI
jgi:hypothetical protein